MRVRVRSGQAIISVSCMKCCGDGIGRHTGSTSSPVARTRLLLGQLLLSDFSAVRFNYMITAEDNQFILHGTSNDCPCTEVEEAVATRKRLGSVLAVSIGVAIYRMYTGLWISIAADLMPAIVKHIHCLTHAALTSINYDPFCMSVSV